MILITMDSRIQFFNIKFLKQKFVLLDLDVKNIFRINSH